MAGTNFPNGIKIRVAGVDKTVTGNATVAAVASANIVGSAGANPTQAEYATAVLLANETKARLNDVIARLKTAGIIL